MYKYSKRCIVSDLIGKTLSSVIKNDCDDMLTFETIDGEKYVMSHDQDCCENVSIESIVGDLNDLIGSPILKAEEATSGDDPDDFKYEGDPKWRDSYTWTFYKFATIKGYVDIRWLGESNGYYSESVDFYKE
jgi:hypothetical protein